MLPFPFPSYMGDGGSTTIETPITYGPWGGSGGTIFDDGMYTGIRQINLKRVSGICMIQILYDRNGQAVWGNKHGYIGTLAISHQVCQCYKNYILLLFVMCIIMFLQTFRCR